MTNDNEPSQPTEQQPKKECAKCDMDEGLLTAFSAARTACELMDDDKQKARCREWTELLDPEKIESAVSIIKETLRYPDGPDALKKHAVSFNITTKRATIELVEEMMAAGENVPDDLMAMFRQAIEERKV